MTTYDQIVTPADWLCSECKRPRAAHTCLGGFHRRKIRFAAMLRIRNEARWIAEVLESIRPLCEWIAIMDDHSNDKTAKICEMFKYDADHNEQVTVLPSPFDGLDEARDKNWLYDQIIAACEPEWILCIDGDEVLEKSGPDTIRQYCKQDITLSRPDSFKLPIAYLWNGRDTWRTDRIYSDFWRPSLFSPFIPDPNKPDDMLVAKEFRFKSTPWGKTVNGISPNFHCSSVPQRRIHGAKLLPARLKHFGYMWREDRVRKLDYLTSIDWKNDAEDWYRHVCQGDRPLLTELPKIRDMIARGVLTDADVRRLLDVSTDDALVHAGPLKVEPWDEDKPWQMSEWARSQG